MTSVSERVALRAAKLKRAKDFSSPEALEEYLRSHPQADRTKHKVDKAKGGPKAPGAKPTGKPPAPKAPTAPPGAKPPKAPVEAKPNSKQPPPIPEAAKKKPAPKAPTEGKGHHDDHDDHHDDHAGKPAGSHLDRWKTTLKGLKDSAAKFVEKAPKAVKSFLGDPDFRKNALKEAKSAATKLPKKAVHRLVETAKEEVHEFKTAAAGIKSMMSGNKMSKHQKHAFRQVATHMAIGAAAAAFAATGPLAGAAVFTKNLATHVAMKSVKKALGNLHTMNELSHIGHGVGHLLEHIASDSKKETDPEEAMTNLILASVAKTIESLKDEDFTKVLNDVSAGDDDSDDDGDADSDDVDDDDEETADKTAALSVLRRFLG